MTIPIAIFIGIYMQFLRPGKIKEGTIIGVILTLLAVVAGPAVQASPVLAPLFTISHNGICIALIVYGSLRGYDCSHGNNGFSRSQ